MKTEKIFIAALCIISLSFTACKNSTHSNNDKISTSLINNPNTAAPNASKTSKGLPKFSFDDVLYNYGKVVQGTQVRHDFRFKNTGNATLIISSARGSCGCTVPTWPKKPIPPGDTAAIHVVFNTNGKVGQEHKTVTIVANTDPNTTVIALDGYVMIPEQVGKNVN